MAGGVGHTGAIRSLQLFLHPLLSPWNDPTQPYILLSTSIDTSVGIWDVSKCWSIRMGDNWRPPCPAPNPVLPPHNEIVDVFAIEREEGTSFDRGPCDDCGEADTASRKYLEFMGVIREAMSVNAAVLEWAKQGHGDGCTGVPAGHWDLRRASRSEWLRVFTAAGTGTWDRVIRVFTGPVDGRRCTQTGTLKGHEDHVHTLLILPGQEWLLSASADRTLRLWCTTDLSQVSAQSVHEKTPS